MEKWNDPKKKMSMSMKWHDKFENAENDSTEKGPFDNDDQENYLDDLSD
jgi:hypothetical protein